MLKQQLSDLLLQQGCADVQDRLVYQAVPVQLVFQVLMASLVPSDLQVSAEQQVTLVRAEILAYLDQEVLPVL